MTAVLFCNWDFQFRREAELIPELQQYYCTLNGLVKIVLSVTNIIFEISVVYVSFTHLWAGISYEGVNFLKHLVTGSVILRFWF